MTRRRQTTLRSGCQKTLMNRRWSTSRHTKGAFHQLTIKSISVPDTKINNRTREETERMIRRSRGRKKGAPRDSYCERRGDPSQRPPAQAAAGAASKRLQNTHFPPTPSSQIYIPHPLFFPTFIFFNSLSFPERLQILF